MSSTLPQPPSGSPFVRGTANPLVFFLQGGQARLVPDAATLALMSAGQVVRTLADAAMAALPRGAALPSRADGTLLTALVPTAAGVPMAYLMQAGLKRHLPDTPTLNALEASGAPAHIVAPADLTGIPDGAVMPSRADGAVYQGAGGPYAFLMRSTLKAAVPDATTLRDAGHDPAGALAISAEDLAAIPTGTALSSTSKFLHPPSADTPLLLLPVRLETRFQGNELWLRIYPDDIHVNSFEPQLTADETATQATYRNQAKAGPQAAQDAFTALAQRFGPERAAWIASAADQVGAKAAQWTRAPHVDVLPERWIVMGYQTDGPGQILFAGPPIPDTLAVGPDPNGPGPATDEGMRWLADFGRAVQVGMACRIPLTGAQTRGFKRLVVFGLRTGLDPAQAAARFGDLLQAHHYTDGLELLPHGAATNNTQDAASGLSSHDPNFVKLFSLEQGPALCPSRATADGDRLARAVGLDPNLLAHVSGADGGQDETAAAINTVLWPATWGYFLEQMVTGAVPAPETLLPLARSHFASHVRARGHFPILRIGRQPYGVLPVMSSAQWKPVDGSALEAPLMSLLTRMRSTWESSVANVPQLHGASDPEAALVSLLGMAPSCTGFVARNLIGPEYNLSFWRFVAQDPGQAWWAALTAKSLAQVGTLSPVMASTRLANATFVNLHRQLTDILVAPAPLDGLPAPDYITQLRPLTWQALRDLPTPAQPALLLLLLRHAALRQYLDTAGELLGKAGAAQPSERIEPELLGLSAGLPRPTAWDLLQRPLAGKGPVGIYLDGAKADPALPVFTAFWTAFDKLSALPATALDFATREALDLASYRLDSWLTSLAHTRLDQIRASSPSGGIVLGAFGWLEDVRPQAPVTSLGFVHAPSLAHATTAAVLRSGYLTHHDGTQSALQLDLSSGRVRLGLHLLDGIREGQALGALLGYRLERSMHDVGLQALIAPLRAIAPLDHPDPGTTPSESLAANNVVDGMALLRKIYAGGTLATGFGLPTDPATRTKVAAVLQVLADALDAVADLTTAESVHQLLRGNTIRAGAALDAIARGDAPPPEIDIVQTPRAGSAFTHRLVTAAAAANPAGWTMTARAKAEPRLNAWAASMLGAPARVRARAGFLDAAGHPAASVEFGLDMLAMAPLDLLALPEGVGLTGELADRLCRAAALVRPATAPAGSKITLIAERNSGWGADIIAVSEFLELVATVSKCAAGARPMTPQDLVMAGDVAGSIDTAELQARADAAEMALRAASGPLRDASGLDAALLVAAGFGIPGSVPSMEAGQWVVQAKSAVDAVKARIAALDQLASGFTRTEASIDALRDHDAARLKAVFGGSFIVLPALDTALTAGWSQLWSNNVVLQGGDALASTTWLQRMARIRPGVARLDAALLYGEALSGQNLMHLNVAQLPVTGGDRWVALKQAGATPTSRLSLVALTPQPIPAAAPVAGLMIDEWVEVLPAGQQITGLTFHQDDPTARAPQTMLLAVRPDAFPEWTLESVEGAVLEALDLAKLRAVDPDSLNALGHYLPALYFAYNAGGPQVDAVSIDFDLLHASAVSGAL